MLVLTGSPGANGCVRTHESPLLRFRSVEEFRFSADPMVIRAARLRAQADGLTLDDAIRAWLAEYALGGSRMARFDATMSALEGKLRVGRRLTRDEMSER